MSTSGSELADDASPLRLRRSHLAILGIILVVGAILRFVHLGEPVYLLDEVWHAELSTGRGSLHMELPRDRLLSAADRPTSLSGAPPWHAVWTQLRGATHPPLYLLTLRAWRGVFGEGEASSRSLSALASLAAIVLLFDTARHLSGPRVALWAAALLAVAGPQVVLARELRGYAFAEMCALGAGAAIARIDRLGSNARRGAALFAFALAALFTHYFAAFAVLALLAYALILFRGRVRWITSGTLAAAMATFLVIWLPHILEQRRAVPGLETGDAVRQSWLSDDGADHALRAVRRSTQLPLRLLVDPPQGYGVLAWLGAIPMALAVALVAWRRQRDLAFWLIWFACTAGALLALDLVRATKHLEFLRYSFLAGAAVCAIVPLLVPRSPRLAWAGNAVLGLVIVLIACALPLAYDKPTPDVRAVANLLDGELRQGDIVAFYPTEGADWYAGNVWLGVAHYSHSFPWPSVILSKPADDSLLGSLRGHHVWLISGSSRKSADEIIPGGRPLRRQYFDGTGTVTCLTLSP